MTTAPQTHVFDAATEVTPLGGDAFRGRTHPAYTNMVGPFGGVTAATLVAAIEGHPDRLGDLLALTVNYTAPVAEGDLDITARAAQTSRTVQHWVLEVTQGSEVPVTATAVTGIRRDTWADTEARMPAAPAPDDVARVGIPDFIEWAKSYEMRFVEGAIPAEGAGEAADSTTTLWVRDCPPRPVDVRSLVAMSDVFYPRVFLRHGRMMAAGTITLTVYVHATPEQGAAQGDSHVLATARGQRFGGGYFDQSAQLWGRDGSLLTTTHQLVYFKE